MSSTLQLVNIGSSFVLLNVKLNLHFEYLVRYGLFIFMASNSTMCGELQQVYSKLSRGGIKLN